MEDRAATSQLLLPATTMKYRLPAALEDRPTTPQLLVSPSAMKEGPSSGQVHAAEGIKEKTAQEKEGMWEGENVTSHVTKTLIISLNCNYILMKELIKSLSTKKTLIMCRKPGRFKGNQISNEIRFKFKLRTNQIK
jgi:hypothetical protein